jgi:hypothetical protein
MARACYCSWCPWPRPFVEDAVSVFGEFLIAAGLYHGGKNVGVALGLTSCQKKA